MRINLVRELIVGRAGGAPAIGDRVVVLIESADRLVMPEAADALLKTLEEPPDWMRFVLTTANKEMLPATILSRCTDIYFGPVSDSQIQEGLERLHNALPDNAALAARDAVGLPGKAVLTILGRRSEDRVSDMITFFEDLAIASKLEALALGERFRGLAEVGDGEDQEASARLAQASLLDSLALWFRDAMDYAERGEAARSHLPIAAASSRTAAGRADAAVWREAAARAVEVRGAILGNAVARLQIDSMLCDLLCKLRSV